MGGFVKNIRPVNANRRRGAINNVTVDKISYEWEGLSESTSGRALRSEILHTSNLPATAKDRHLTRNS